MQALKWQQAQRVPLGAQKKSIFLGPTPSNSLSIGSWPHQNNYSRTIKNRYFSNFMYMSFCSVFCIPYYLVYVVSFMYRSFRAPPLPMAFPLLAVWVGGGGGASKKSKFTYCCTVCRAQYNPLCNISTGSLSPPPCPAPSNDYSQPHSDSFSNFLQSHCSLPYSMSSSSIKLVLGGSL